MSGAWNNNRTCFGGNVMVDLKQKVKTTCTQHAKKGYTAGTMLRIAVVTILNLYK